ncbi:MAG: BON domain-containing protein [Sulfuriflexus sp.]|nr:BON domain-containing protein [Sulfuriflexus sp.]
MMNKSLLILILSVLSVTSLLTGCAGALLGNGGERPRNNETREQRSIEQITADGMITSSIRTRYSNDVVLKKLNISTYRGVVTLHGVVPTKNVMGRAIRLAQSVNGVKSVRSGIRLR